MTLSMRDTVATAIANLDAARELGLPENAVYQADTLDSPSTKPFIVIRWEDVESRMGQSAVSPFTIWVYDDFGDYNRADAIAKAVAKGISGKAWLPQKHDTGWVSQIEDRRQGRDLADDGFDALVIPYSFAAIASGV